MDVGKCYGSPVYLHVNSLIRRLVVVQYMRVDSTGVNAYAIRIKLYKT